MTRTVALLLALAWSWTGVADPVLPEHPGIVAGALDNGVRYRILSHAVPPGRVSLRLHLPVGSLNEADDERGYAHLLEHVAFTGSENYPRGEATPFFESLGMTFGRHQNAVTAVDRTFYTLELPDTTDATLGAGLTFLADVLGRLEITDDGVAQEREIVLAERRNGLGPHQRLLEQWVPRVLAGSRAAARMVLGAEETVRAATADRLEAFYRRWYTTGNATVVLVGDLPVERALAAIEDAFGGLPARPATAAVDPGAVRYDAPFGVVATDPEAGPTEVTIVRVDAARPPVTTRDGMRASLVEALALHTFNRRVMDRVSAGEVAYQRGGTNASSFFGTGWIATASAVGEAADWRAMLGQIATDVHRARTHGFGDAEIATTRMMMLAGAKQFAQAADTLPSPFYAAMLLSAVQEGGVMMSAAQQLEQMEALLPGIGADEVSAAFRDLFEPDRIAVTLLTRAGDAVPSEDELLAVAMDAFGAEVAAVAAQARPTAVLARLPTPGAVVDDDTDDDSGVYSAWLSNGARFHHRAMDEQKNHVEVRITLAGGVIEETPGTYGHTQAAVGILQRLAARSRSSTELRDLIAGHAVSIGWSTDADAVYLDLSGAPDALEIGFQIAHLLLSEPLIEPVAFGQWQRAVAQALEATRTNVNAELAREFAAARYPAEDRRWHPLTVDEVAALERDRVQAWVDAFVRRAPLDIAIVGDIDRERALALATRYVASLPARERIRRGLFAQQREVPPPPPFTRTATVATSTPRAAVRVGFAGAPPARLDDRRALAQAARILTTRMTRRIREEEGLVYSVAARHSTDEALDGFSTFGSTVSVDPKDAERVADIVEELFAAFAADGPTPEEVEVATRQFDTTFDETERDPRYWTNRLADLTYRDVQPVVSVAATRDGYRALTAARIHDAFKRYHAADTHYRLIVTPEDE